MDQTDVVVEGETQRGIVAVGASVASLTVEGASGQILALNSVGGVRQVAEHLSGIQTGGELIISNLQLDPVNKRVIADVVATPLVFNPITKAWAPGISTEQKGLNLWSVADVVGPTALSAQALLAAKDGDPSLLVRDGYRWIAPTLESPSSAIGATNVFKGLKITNPGFAFVTSALGMRSGSVGYQVLLGVNGQPDGWGTISSEVVMAMVPEPSTYALMALGLVGITLVARRRPT